MPIPSSGMIRSLVEENEKLKLEKKNLMKEINFKDNTIDRLYVEKDEMERKLKEQTTIMKKMFNHLEVLEEENKEMRYFLKKLEEENNEWRDYCEQLENENKKLEKEKMALDKLMKKMDEKYLGVLQTFLKNQETRNEIGGKEPTTSEKKNNTEEGAGTMNGKKAEVDPRAWRPWHKKVSIGSEFAEPTMERLKAENAEQKTKIKELEKKLESLKINEALTEEKLNKRLRIAKNERVRFEKCKKDNVLAEEKIKKMAEEIKELKKGNV